MEMAVTAGPSCSQAETVLRPPGERSTLCPWCGTPEAHPGAGKTASGAPGAPAIPGYEVLERLGRGSMGVVYAARDLRLNRRVALKIIPDLALASPEDLVRFLGEAEVAAQLQHPNIVPVHAVGQHEGRPFFTMELVAGGTLAGLAASGPVPPRRAAELVEAVARAVHHAHRRQVVHRDLKPANVLLTEDGTPKIADFGLAKRLDVGTGLTQTGTLLGTPRYMAPEQAEGLVHDVGPLTDVYALGTILYELLTGRPPFRGDSLLHTLEAVVHRKPAPPRDLCPETPRALEAVCLKCLEKAPGRRHASAEAVADDLRRFLDGRLVSARPRRRRAAGG
jgi:serine/threonine protein kinase